jgi:hypothetical protein
MHLQNKHPSLRQAQNPQESIWELYAIWYFMNVVLSPKLKVGVLHGLFNDATNSSDNITER